MVIWASLSLNEAKTQSLTEYTTAKDVLEARFAKMVLLTMTSTIVEALNFVQDPKNPHTSLPDTILRNIEVDEPSIEDPKVGKPISHGQILDTWKSLRARGHTEFRLENMLRGATVYVPPPPPKPEPTEEYKALMARLRREEEERSYERMIRTAPTRESFAERFPLAPMAHSFAEVNKPSKMSDVGGDDIEFGDVQRQVTLIVNFLVSVFGCGIALWKAAQWWPVSSRLLLSLGGAIVVAITEVAVYSAYTWRMAEGDKKELKKKERREVVHTWVVGEEGDKANTEGIDTPILVPTVASEKEANLRRRRLETAHD
ncbi:endoplasmic reticulum-based factor for assembly of V-ATPase-domain-containing protein [Xylariaceae sp. FL0594]|nr:endoplasmic reticulum-based factor for assembly of V-ATPase-domain-containing protein [Xylariaceae sp. FL0594]